ncbi:MAG: hypothetical protein AABY15_06340, partial [Nanoarchaeota archaeon]
MESSLYRIEGFQPPRYIFELSLQCGFAKGAFEKELPESLHRELQEEGRCLAEKTFSDAPIAYQPYIFLENFAGKTTCLLSNIEVLGVQEDAHTLDIGPNFDFN